MLDLLAIVVLLVSLLLIAPGYFYMRRKMTKTLGILDQPLSYYSKRKVQLFTILLLTLLLSPALVGLLTLIGIKQRSISPIYTSQDLLFLSIFLCIWAVIGMGVGLYLASILIEKYTLSGLMDEPEFSRQRIPTRMFHGPISHILIFTGGYVVALSLSVFEILNPAAHPVGVDIYSIYGLLGMIVGLIMYECQIHNLTWKYQLPWAIFFSTVYLLIMLSMETIKLTLPYNFFFLTLAASYTLSLELRMLKSKRRNRAKSTK